MKFAITIKRQLGLALMLERQKRHWTTTYAAKRSGMTAKTLERLELGNKKNGWRHYGQMLDLYHMDVEVKLVKRKPLSAPNEKIEGSMLKDETVATSQVDPWTTLRVEG